MMKKNMAIQSYLFSQLRYDIGIGWAINAFICITFIILSFFIPEHVTLMVTPSAAIYIIVGVIGMKWIGRTLSYLLRLGVNRTQYSMGTITFTLLYNLFNAVLVALFYFLIKFIDYLQLNTSMSFMHPVQLVTDNISFMSIVLFDFIVFTIISFVTILLSIAYHRIGKLGGNLVLAIFAILLVLNITFNGIISMFKWLITLDSIIALLIGILVIIGLAIGIYFATKRISIVKASI